MYVTDFTFVSSPKRVGWSPYTIPTPRCDGIERRALCEVLRFRWGHEVLSLPCEDTVRILHAPRKGLWPEIKSGLELHLGLSSFWDYDKCLLLKSSSMVFGYGRPSTVKIFSITSTTHQGIKVRRDIPQLWNPEYPRPSFPRFLNTWDAYQVSGAVPGTWNHGN